MNMKTTRYEKKYLDKYNDIPGIQPPKLGSTYACCVYCTKDFTIHSSGVYDITRHKQSKFHENTIKQANSHKTINAYLKPAASELTPKAMHVMRAEAMMPDMIVSLNLPITAKDTFNKVLKKAFPDSAIASDYECGRSKTTELIKVMAKVTRESLAEKMKAGPYSLSSDGSNDQRLKQFPVVITVPGNDGVT